MKILRIVYDIMLGGGRGCIYYAWEHCSKFRDMVTKSSVLLGDKQNPAIVAELSFTYQIMYDLGFISMGLYLECINLLLRSFFDKSLTPEERLKSLGCVKAVFTLWYETSHKLKCLSLHFITSQSYKDIICTIDGFILYFFKMSQEFPDGDIVPWYYTSDACELFFAFARIGRFLGRKTNLDADDANKGLENKNQSLILDYNNTHLLDHEVAHTRGHTLIPSQLDKPAQINKGRDVKLSLIRDSLNQGAKIGTELFKENCYIML